MTTHDPRDEDAGYGGGNLVGSSQSGLRSAIEARQAVAPPGRPARDGAVGADAIEQRTARSDRAGVPDAAPGATPPPVRVDAPRASSGDDPRGTPRDARNRRD
jgi:hypothetical protein